MQHAFDDAGYELTDKAIAGVVRNFHGQRVEDVFAEVGEGRATGLDVLHAVYPGSRKKARRRNVVPFLPRRREKDKNPLLIKGLTPGVAVHMAGCCHPIPGDRIVGIMTTGKGVTVHTIDCEALESFDDMPERWLDIAWDMAADGPLQNARLKVVIANEPGSLGVLSTVVGREGGNISNLKITDRSSDFFELLLDIEVSDVKQLTDIQAALRATSVINSVERARV